MAGMFGNVGLGGSFDDAVLEGCAFGRDHHRAEGGLNSGVSTASSSRTAPTIVSVYPYCSCLLYMTS
jgi:hypothetical protein